MKIIVSDHAYTRAWSRCLFSPTLHHKGVNIRNRKQLAERFESAFTNADRFYFAKGQRVYKCHDGILNYIFFANDAALVLATVYPVKRMGRRVS